MNSLNGARLTRRGRLAVSLLVFLALTGIYYLATHVWWMGDGWCLDTLTNCLLTEQAPVDGANS